MHFDLANIIELHSLPYLLHIYHIGYWVNPLIRKQINFDFFLKSIIKIKNNWKTIEQTLIILWY